MGDPPIGDRRVCSGAGLEVMHVVVGLVREKLGMHRAQVIGGPLLGGLVVAHRDTHDVVAGTPMVGVPAHICRRRR